MLVATCSGVSTPVASPGSGRLLYETPTRRMVCTGNKLVDRRPGRMLARRGEGSRSRDRRDPSRCRSRSRRWSGGRWSGRSKPSARCEAGSRSRSARSGRGGCSRSYHDMGDRVRPDEPLVELDPVDAKLVYDIAESRYLGRAGQARDHGRSGRRLHQAVRHHRDLIRGKQAEEAIARSRPWCRSTWPWRRRSRT